MIIPVRCMSCGKPVGQFWDEFQEKRGERSEKELLDEMGVKRYCCRAIMMGHVDLIDTASKFKRF